MERDGERDEEQFDEERLDELLDPKVLEKLKLHGDRTSSFLTAYPGFEAHDCGPDSSVRYYPTSSAWVGATEPLAPIQMRPETFRKFSEQARREGKLAVMLPVSQELASRLSAPRTETGRPECWRMSVGSEPVFDLTEFFGRAGDPLTYLPSARQLLRKGAQVSELAKIELESLRTELDSIAVDWLSSRKAEPFGFLGQSKPWLFVAHRKIFVLRLNGKVHCFVSAVPVPAMSAFYFVDLIRSSTSLPGSTELLMIESMRELSRQGCREVRLGLCPLSRMEEAKLPQNGSRATGWLLRQLVQRGGALYGFKSLEEFKTKLRPTRWEPLYLVSGAGRGIRGNLQTLVAVKDAVFPEGLARSILRSLVRSANQARRSWLERYLIPALHGRVAIRPLPASLSEFLARSRVTLSATILFLTLHIVKITNPTTAAVFARSGFRPGEWSWESLVLSSVFHTNAYHMSGNLLSLLFFGAIVEVTLGARVLSCALAASLWASNPLTTALLYHPIQALSPAAFAKLLAEQDYGSSNGVYACVGAMAGLLAQPRWVLTPFILNAIFLCVVTASWLSLHHVAGLALGFLICRLRTR